MGSERARIDFSVQIARRVEIRVGARRAPVEASITGRVVDDDGAPIEGALVVATPDSEGEGAALRAGGMTTSDAEGRFSLESLDPGTYVLTATSRGLRGARGFIVHASARDVTLRLGRGGRLVGRVRAAASGEPLRSFVVNVWRRPDAIRLERVAGEVIFTADGRYELAGLPSGELRVSVFAEGSRSRPSA